MGTSRFKTGRVCELGRYTIIGKVHDTIEKRLLTSVLRKWCKVQKGHNFDPFDLSNDL